jgi:hypothetical protein
LLKLLLFREVCFASECNLHRIKSKANRKSCKVKRGGDKTQCKKGHLFYITHQNSNEADADTSAPVKAPQQLVRLTPKEILDVVLASNITSAGEIPYTLRSTRK